MLLDNYDASHGAFSELRHKGPAFSQALKTNTEAICEGSAKALEEYNSGNKYVEVFWFDDGCSHL